MNELSAAVHNLRARVLDGDVAALARAISAVEGTGEFGRELHRAIRSQAGGADIVGITGPPGVGKSSLINALVTELRGHGERVAVVAVDPSSPVTGGSVLGDRTRMGQHTDDPGVYIRSVSARGGVGGLSDQIMSVLDLIDAAGWQFIILETVGAGQSETDVAEVADTNVVVNAPGYGDDVQAIKAGILEIADVLVVNKADLPAAGIAVRQLEAMLKLRTNEAANVPVVSTVATEGSGITNLLAAIRECNRTPINKADRTLARTRRLLAREAARQLKQRLLNDECASTVSLIESVAEGERDLGQGVSDLLDHHFQSGES